MTAAVRALRYLRVSRADQNVALQDDDTNELISRRGWALVDHRSSVFSTHAAIGMPVRSWMRRANPIVGTRLPLAHPRSDASVQPIFEATSLMERPEVRFHLANMVEPVVGPTR